MSSIRHQHSLTKMNRSLEAGSALGLHSGATLVRDQSAAEASQGYALERWLKATKLQSRTVLDEPTGAAQLPAAWHDSPPPFVPHEPATATPSNDWLRVPTDIYVEGARGVISCRACSYTGIVHDYRVDLIRMNS